MATLFDKVRFQPVVQSDGTLAPSKEELAYAQEKAAEGGFLELNKKYEELNKQLKSQSETSRKSAGLSSAPVSPEEATSFVKSLKKPDMPPAGGMPAASTGTEILAQPAESAMPESVKEKVATEPPSPLLGGTPPSGAPTDESKPATSKEQAKKDTDVEKVLRESGELIAKLGGNKKVDRSQLQSYLDKLDTLTPDTQAATPETQRFVQARADAYRAYKEKADRNDWLEIAQNLVNSITQFASAQQAMGTRFEGGNLPLKGIDYGARTARAGREYEMELGQVGAEEKAAETASERADRLRREELLLKRQTLGEKIGAERERVRQQESDVKDAERQALNLYNIINSNRRNDADNLAALERKTAEIEGRGRAAASKDLDNHIKALEAEAKALTPKIQSANALSGSTKDAEYKKNLANFATNLGKSEDELKAEADSNSGWFTLDKTYIKENIAGKQASEWAKQQQDLQRQIVELRKIKFGGEQPATQPPAPAQPTATTPSTIPTRTGKVKVLAPNGQQGEIDAAQVDAFLAKYPGSKVVQ